MSERPWETSLGETVQEAGTDLGAQVSAVCLAWQAPKVTFMVRREKPRD